MAKTQDDARILVAEFARIGAAHDDAVVRTVARAAIPGSVSRVFASGTKKAIVDLLPTLDLRALAEVRDQAAYRSWFVRSLERVSATILELNAPDVRPGIHPGYMWGHGTKVLSLFVRDLAMHSRHFPVDVVERLAPLLYCPVDGIVIDRLRHIGVDPGVRRIREIDQDAFWSIQSLLGEAAAAAGVPRVWFDDVWSENRT